jgi:hypothetical protein
MLLKPGVLWPGLTVALVLTLATLLICGALGKDERIRRRAGARRRCPRLSLVVQSAGRGLKGRHSELATQLSHITFF